MDIVVMPDAVAIGVLVWYCCSGISFTVISPNPIKTNLEELLLLDLPYLLFTISFGLCQVGFHGSLNL